MSNNKEHNPDFDEKIVEYVERKRLNVNGVYADIPEKIGFLREVLGYDRLIVGKNQFCSLKDCAPSRISAAVMQIYSGAKRRLEEHRKVYGICLERTIRTPVSF